MRLLYFGNKLSGHGRSKSVIETLEPLLAEFGTIKTYSDKINPAIRCIHMICGFFKSLRNTDYVIVDVYSTAYFNLCFLLSTLSILFRKKYILFLHGGNLPARYVRSRGRMNFMLKRANSIISPSLYLKGFFQENDVDVVHIPNIISIDKFPFHLSREIKPRLLYVRGFSQIYNPEMAIMCLNIVKEKYPDVLLTMIGTDHDGTMQNVSKMVSQLELDNNVKILGKLNQAEWVEHSKEHSLMISTPVLDNAPVSLLEGMALGLPVISTNVGGVPDLVEDSYNGLLVESNNHLQLANAVLRLLGDHELYRRIQINARNQAERFTWSHVKPHWMQIFSK